MSNDQGTGTAGQGNVGAGNTGGTSGAGNTGGGNSPASAAGAPAAGAAAPWHGITDAEIASYIDNKGWKAPADVVASYRGAEKLIGRDPNTLLVLPRADDPEGFRAVAAKLGMPEKATEYKLHTLEGTDPDPNYVGHVQEVFHKAGLTKAQAEAISKGHNEFMAKAAAQAAKDYDLNVQSDKAALQKEWGGGYDRMMGRAQLAARTLGIPAAAIDALEQAMGYAGTMKMFAEVGGKLGEDGFTGGSGAVRFSSQMTPAEAQAEWDAMKADDKARAALFDNNHPGHKAAKEKQAKLFAIIHGTAPVI